MAKGKSISGQLRNASKRSALKSQLLASVKVHEGKRLNAGQKDYVALARTAADLVGTSKAKSLLESRDVSALSKELNISGGFGGLGKLNDLSAGRNRPLGMSDGKWSGLGKRLSSLNSKGYSNEEIAAAIRFDRLLRDAL